MVTLLPELAGHRASRLYILDLGLFQVHAGRTIGIPAYLVETDRGALILIDTGFPPAYADDPALGTREGLDGFGHLLGHDASRTLPGQLTRLGRTPADIGATVLSHSHIDHVGALGLVAHAPIIMTTRERAEPRPLYHGKVRPLDWPVADYRLIDRATELCRGVTLLPTPGHTPGHLSVLLTLPETGAVILAADAINRASEPDEGFPDAMDPVAAKTSAEGLFALERNHSAWLIWGHDPVQWPTLKKAPAFYR